MKFTLIGILFVCVTIFCEILRQIKRKKIRQGLKIGLERARYLLHFGIGNLPIGEWHISYSLPNQKIEGDLYPEFKGLFSVIVTNEEKTTEFVVISENPIPKRFRIVETPNGKEMQEISE